MERIQHEKVESVLPFYGTRFACARPISLYTRQIYPLPTTVEIQYNAMRYVYMCVALLSLGIASFACVGQN